MVRIINNEGCPVIVLDKMRVVGGFINCQVSATFQADKYDYFPSFLASVSLDFSPTDIVAFIDDLKQMYSFKKEKSVFYDVERCFVIHVSLSKEDGHITCECQIGNSVYGSLSFAFTFDQTMIPNLITEFRWLLSDDYSNPPTTRMP